MNGQKAHLHVSRSRWGKMADRHVCKQTSQREDVEHQTCKRCECGSRIEGGNDCGSTEGPDDPRSRAMIESHNLTHLPAAGRLDSTRSAVVKVRS